MPARFDIVPSTWISREMFDLRCNGVTLLHCWTRAEADALAERLSGATVQTIVDLIGRGDPSRVLVMAGDKKIGIIPKERWSAYDAAPLDHWSIPPVRCVSDAAAEAAPGYEGVQLLIEYSWHQRLAVAGQ